MSPDERAAFINAQTQMMRAQERIMAAENEECRREGLPPVNGPEEWKNLRDQWDPVLGYNALIVFFAGG